MLCIKVFFVMFICYSMTIKCEINVQMISKIMQHVHVNSTSKSNIVHVRIDQLAECRIYMYSLKNQQLPVNFSKIDTFYTALGCKIADWALNVVYVFVKCSSIFQPHKSYTDREDSDECNYDFKDHFSTFVSTFLLDVEKLIELLNDFFDLAPQEAYYKDTSILKALLSLHINVNLLSMNFHKNKESKAKIVRIMTKEMTFVQSFMSMNCTKPFSNNENSPAIDFWITTDDQPKKPYEYLFLYNSRTLIISRTNDQPASCPRQTI